MKTHNAFLYHCLICGSVAHVELNAESPYCCGQKMAKAGAETIRDDEEQPNPAISHCQTAPPVPQAGR